MLVKSFFCHIGYRRYYSDNALKYILANDIKPEFVRNIGIIAHIDAGKTTTTERMLYNSGMISRPGNVDSGNTVMDYLRQERERGITITSATISFPWLNEYRINLIDTPGHVDFTMEVERSLRVLDGAIAIIDGTAGVEAQTETVWLQSNHYQLPRLIFINKLDREDFSLSETLFQIKSRLACPYAAPVQTAFFEVIKLSNSPDSEFIKYPWLIDLVTLELIGWFEIGTAKYLRLPFDIWSKDSFFTGNSSAPLDHILLKRTYLLETICDKDDRILEIYLENTSQIEKISSFSLIEAIKRLTINGAFVPVLYGASLRNWGIQPLLDAVIRYLPSPTHNLKPCIQESGVLGSAFVFKVIVDEKKGLMAFVRVYSGMLKSKAIVFNSTKKAKERISKILHMTSDDGIEMPCVSLGNFAVLLGLKKTSTGDTLIFPESESSFYKSMKSSTEQHYIFSGLKIPTPIYFRSIDVENSSDEEGLIELLKKLELEDPSFKFEKNFESGQLLMSGMGELHLEIISDRIIKDFNFKVKLGSMNIAYKESIPNACASSIQLQETIDKEILGKRMHAGIFLTICPKSIDSPLIGINATENTIVLEKGFISQDSLDNIPSTIEELEELILEHVQLALSNGPINGFPCIGLAITIHNLVLFTDSTVSSIRAVISDTIQICFRTNKIMFSKYEPIMLVKVRTPKDLIGCIIADINTSCKGSILSINDEIVDTKLSEPSTYSIIDAEVPLISMSGYSSKLRSISSGTASFSMSLKGYAGCQ